MILPNSAFLHALQRFVSASAKRQPRSTAPNCWFNACTIRVWTACTSSSVSVRSIARYVSAKARLFLPLSQLLTAIEIEQNGIGEQFAPRSKYGGTDAGSGYRLIQHNCDVLADCRKPRNRLHDPILAGGTQQHTQVQLGDQDGQLRQIEPLANQRVKSHPSRRQTVHPPAA